ncbi:MAG: hypothetical protein QW647_04500 [Candidatus Bathyarchaeia archaeon]
MLYSCTYTPKILIEDGVHNFIDSLVMTSSFLVLYSLGFAKTLAIILHEVHQEIEDFNITLHSGFIKRKFLLSYSSTTIANFF